MSGDETALPPYQGYGAYFRVRHHEMDALGHVNNAVYLHYLEQAAIQHSNALGYDTSRLVELGGLFIARRHEIDYLRPAFADDLLQAVTWAAEMTGARAAREYVILRHPLPLDGQLPLDGFLAARTVPSGEVVVRARTLWVWVDRQTHRPRRIPPILHADFLATQAASGE